MGARKKKNDNLLTFSVAKKRQENTQNGNKPIEKHNLKTKKENAKENAKESEKDLQKIADKLHRFEELLGFGRLVTSSMDYKNIQKKASGKVKKFLKCKHVAIYRYDEKSEELVNKGPDYKREGLSEIRYPIDLHSFVGACAHYRAILQVSDISSDIRFKREPSTIQEMGCNNILLVPLVHEGELLGVIQALSTDVGVFNEEDVEFLEAMASQLAVAIENMNLFEKLNRQFIQVVEALAAATVKRDQYTGGHNRRVVVFSEMIAKELNLSFKESNDLRLAAIMHDVGKIGIEDKILKKTTALSEEEFEIMKRHPYYGYEILQNIEGFAQVVDGIRYHHERFDGKGYPSGLKGDEIPILAQIISVADTFDAITSNRPYRKGLAPMDAYYEILRNSGSQFSPMVVEAFERAFKNSHMYRPLSEEEKWKKTG